MIHPFGVTGFNLLTALSTRNDAPRKSVAAVRSATAMASCSAKAPACSSWRSWNTPRSAARTFYAELTGYGSTADAFRVTDSHPDGRGAIACIEEALKDSRPESLRRSATSTPTAPAPRSTTASRRWRSRRCSATAPIRFRSAAPRACSAILIAAAGAVELIICVEAIRRGVMPPTINYETPDPECDLDYIPNVPREKRVRHALSNSFGFGGQNISLIVSRFDN